MEYMPQPRLLHDMLILPTGQILIINGAKHGCAGFDNARNASLEPYPPKRYLGKGSTLLPDGRVLVGGGNPHPRYIFRNVAYPTELRLQAFVPHYMDKRYHNKRPMNLTIEYVNAILEAPPSSFVAPSGYYLLTVVNAGIPSISQWIRFTHNG
ncbi:uncharacterized protein DS421_7g198750 [Arachis hypogaea]|nr:uncharacterized protein DS421_7g198750 [Arachis hypogaea]